LLTFEINNLAASIRARGWVKVALWLSLVKVAPGRVKKRDVQLVKLQKKIS
jgi:hypothetical protein